MTEPTAPYTPFAGVVGSAQPAPQAFAPIAPAGLPSPLELIDPARLDEIFAKDPLKITDEELRAMVLHYRARRAEWKAADDAGTTPGKRAAATRAAKSAAGASPEALSNLSLGDLL